MLVKPHVVQAALGNSPACQMYSAAKLSELGIILKYPQRPVFASILACVLCSGYGVRSPTDCWLSAWIVALQSIWAAILNAVTLGIIFARISQPKQRARTIFISDSAVIARRDGILKFMFRVADIRTTQVTHL